MAEMAYAEERQRCKRCYERLYFVKKIVALYEEGVSWEGCKVVAPADPDKIPQEYNQIIGIDALKVGVRGMMVDGIGEFEVQIRDDPRKLSIPTPPISFLRVEAPGRPFLWPYIQNDQTLEELAEGIKKLPETETIADWLIRDLIEGICRGLGVPLRFLQNNVITDAPVFVKDALTIFEYEVERLRTQIAFHLTKEIGPLICKTLNYEGPVKVVWNKDWIVHGIGGYGPVYQAFKAQGILLEGLAQGMIKIARQLWEASLGTRAEYEEAMKWFG